MTSAVPWMWLFMLCLTTPCNTSESPPRPSSQATVASAEQGVASVAVDKIASPIRQVMRQMQDDGLTIGQESHQTTTAYSSPLVRVDAAGRIQTDIQVTGAEPEVISELRASHVDIDWTDGDQIIQGWIPFEQVEVVAALPFVQALQSPRYTVQR